MTRAGMHRTTPSPFYKDGVNIKPNVGATDKLLLPFQATPSAPTIAFGDGDTGFYEEADDSLIVSIATTASWKFASTYFGSLSLSARLLAAAPSATVPSIIPVGSDSDTGIGTAGADILSLIAGAIEGIRITEVAGYTKVQLQLIPTVNAPAYTEGAMYFDSTLHKLRIGGAAGWETITSV